MTGRPPLGDVARTVQGNVKVSEREQKYLIRKYGTVSAGLRAALDKMLPDSVHRPARAARPAKVVNTQELLFSDGKCKHPGWKVVGHGSLTHTIIKECRACGERRTETE
jgi:hypothetical protein